MGLIEKVVEKGVSAIGKVSFGNPSPKQISGRDREVFRRLEANLRVKAPPNQILPGVLPTILLKRGPFKAKFGSKALRVFVKSRKVPAFAGLCRRFRICWFVYPSTCQEALEG